MPETNPNEFAELLREVLHASYHLTNAAIRSNYRRTKTPELHKRRAVDKLFRLVFGRKASKEEHAIIGTESYSYGGY